MAVIKIIDACAPRTAVFDVEFDALLLHRPLSHSLVMVTALLLKDVPQIVQPLRYCMKCKQGRQMAVVERKGMETT